MVENYAKAVPMDLNEWLSLNPLPSICEEKSDGFRVFIFKSDGKILLATRHGRIYSDSSHPLLFKKIEILKAPEIPKKVIFDGEYVAPDKLHIFDLLRVDDRDLTSTILIDRKRILSDLLSGPRKLFAIPWVLVNSVQEILDYKKSELSKGNEGIIVKNPSSLYGQRNSWLKLKRFDTVDCFIIGVERTLEMDRSGVPHSWFIGIYDENNQVLEIGKVGTYLKEVDPTRIKVGTVVEIQYQEFTVDKKLRGPFIIKIREDKIKEECNISQIPGYGRN
jgi:ATP-dependent DNA ligase